MLNLKLTQERFLPFLTSNQVNQMPDKEKAVVVLPVASIEQHGPHLPVFTDSIIVQAVLEKALEKLPKDFPVWVLPIQCYGKSNEHAGFPGTFTLTSETFVSLLKEYGANVYRNGFKRLVFLNAHGGNTEIIDFVIRDIREQTNLLVFALHVGLRVATPTTGLSEDERTFGIHAGDVETSILLDYCPQYVKMDLAPNGLPSHLQSMNTQPFMGALNFAWLTRDITPSGVLGNAKTADPLRGKKYLDDAAIEVANLFEKIRKFEFEIWKT